MRRLADFLFVGFVLALMALIALFGGFADEGGD